MAALPRAIPVHPSELDLRTLYALYARVRDPEIF